MKNKKYIKTLCFGLAALILVVGLNVGNVLAYFTTYATAKGEVSMSLKFPNTDITEEIRNLQKIVTVNNVAEDGKESGPCYVRIKLITSKNYTGNIVLGDNTTGWSDKEADGYYYYGSKNNGTILDAGESTTPIYLGFELPTSNPEYTSFNAIVVQECTPVLYNQEGEPYADWNLKAVISNAAGSASMDRTEGSN